MPDGGHTASVSAALPRDGSAPRVARDLVTSELGAHLPPDRVDAVRLAVSELVANAVLHGEGPIELRVQADESRIRGEVVDGGGGFEHELRERGPDDLGGRGLLLVAALADDWGVHEGTTHVWFEMAARSQDPRPSEPRLGVEARPPELPDPE